ncbi:MAG: hypothetical protein LUH01_03760 [Parabacteroides gordonii]|nr:hypothetical protein [Parabacteroides gordonii]
MTQGKITQIRLRIEPSSAKPIELEPVKLAPWKGTTADVGELEPTETTN